MIIFLIYLAAVMLVLPIAPTQAQTTPPANFVERAGALQSELSQWRRILANLSLTSLPVTEAERQLLLQDRSTCLDSIGILDTDIKRVEQRATLEGEVRVVQDTQRLQGVITNLEDSLRVMRPKPPAFRVDNGPGPPIFLGITSPLEGYWENLYYQLGQQVDAVGAPISKTQQPGEIYGHIYRADTGRPLKDVKVMLGLPSSFGPPFRIAQTSADGSYRFTNIPPGSYRVGAYRADFTLGRYGRNQYGGWGTVNLVSGKKLGYIDIKLNPLARVTQMNEEALEDAFGTGRLWLQFGRGYFSPDGKLFAFVIYSDPQQAWVYDMKSRLLTCATDKPPGGFGGVTIVWSGDTLYAEYTRGGGHDQFFEATPQGQRQIPELPAAAQEAFRQEIARQTGAACNSRFIVTVQNHGRGSLILMAQTTEGHEPFQIASGGWELGSSIFEDHGCLVLFPRLSAISVFNLNTRQLQESYLPNRVERLLAASPEPDGCLVAYTSYGPCQGYGDNGGLYPIHPQRAPHNVCFAKITIGEQK